MALTQHKNHSGSRPWAEYSALLVERGSLHELFKIVRKWADLLERDNESKVTKGFTYPSALFDFAGKFYEESSRSFRYLEGFIDSLSELLHFPAPSYSTLRRRIYALELSIVSPRNNEEKATPKDMAIDSSGFKIKGPGEYLQHKHHPSTRQDYEKTHIIVQVDSHEILCTQTTSGRVHDCTQLPNLIVRAVQIQKGDHLYGDKAYGGHDDYQACIDYHLNPVFPPKSNARSRSRGGPLLRSARIWEYQKIGHEAWKQKYGYADRCAVEQTFAYKKQLFGRTMRAKNPANFAQEERLKATYFNRYMRDLFDL
jgi:hypothetical protein